jgi:hypothetical protein
MNNDEIYIAIPGFACIIMFLCFLTLLWRRDKQMPFFDIGMFCAFAILVYTVYPLMNYWAGGMQFGIFSDARLFRYDVKPFELGLFHLRHVLYFFFFIVFYLLFRRKGALVTGNIIFPRQSTMHLIAISLLFLTAYFFVLRWETGIVYNPSYTSGEYFKNFQRLSDLPIILVQISGKLQGIFFISKLALLLMLITVCRQRKWFLILMTWLIIEIIYTVHVKGSRANMLLFIITAFLFYHRIIKPFNAKFLVITSAAVFVFFILIGLARDFRNVDNFNSVFSHKNMNVLAANNEFQSMLGTEYDVYQRKLKGAVLPWYLYMNDFISIFPPRQIIPFEKVSASEWYLREIGLSGTGQGFMWGVISQSIVGLDWIELILRGALLGYVLAKIHNWYLGHQTGFLETLFYVFLCINIYNTFRDTTFAFLVNIVWQIIPFYILLCIGRILVPKKTYARNLEYGQTYLNAHS